jgi:hypothetical protein
LLQTEQWTATEAMVSINSCRYSVPPACAGRDVTVERSGNHGTVVIRRGDVIVAEHAVARRRGESITQKEDIDELWKLALLRTPAPLPNWQLTFGHAVDATPLDRYERVADCSAGRRTLISRAKTAVARTAFRTRRLPEVNGGDQSCRSLQSDTSADEGKELRRAGGSLVRGIASRREAMMKGGQ